MPPGTLARARPTPAAIPTPEAEADDALLARFARSGDQDAFTQLVRRHAPAVLGVCRRILRDDHAAEDAFQAVFMVLAGKPEAVTRPEALAGWLYGVALRVALKERARREPAATGEPVEAAVIPDPATALAADELRVVLDEELTQLPDPERDLLVLVYLDGKTHDEAARILGCPLGSVAWRLNRARESLRRRLARRGVALSVGLLLLLASIGETQAASEALVRQTVSTAIAARTTLTPTAPPTARPPWLRPLAFLLGFMLTVGCALGAWAVFDHPPPAANPSPHSAPTPESNGDGAVGGCCNTHG